MTPTNIQYDIPVQSMYFLTLLSGAEFHSVNSIVLKGISELHLKCENTKWM